MLLQMQYIPFLIAEWYSTCIYSTSFSSIDRHLDCYLVLAVAHSAMIKLGVHISCWILFSFPLNIFLEVQGHIELQDQMVVVFLILWGTSLLVSIAVRPFHTYTHTPCTCAAASLSSIFLQAPVVSCLPGVSCPNRCEAIPHCGFHFHFLDILWHRASS